MADEQEQAEWRKMITEILTSAELKYGCRLTDWEVNRLDEWSKMPILTINQGHIIERIYKEKM
jgi:hypothetical protein